MVYWYLSNLMQARRAAMVHLINLQAPADGRAAPQLPGESYSACSRLMGVVPHHVAS